MKRNRISSVGLVLATVLVLSVAGVVVAQAQLPGNQLTSDPANDLRPAWSPDGTKLAFFSNRSGSNNIWIMDADGRNQRQLTNDSADNRRPVWSPDGAWIAFDSDRAGTRDLWIMDTEGGNLRQLTSDAGQETFPAWSPDGSQIAYYSFAEGVLDLWAVDVEGKNPRPVMPDLADERMNQCTFACHTPAWSPDSTQIAYPAMNQTQIWVVGTDGHDSHQLATGDMPVHYPSWTPDGKILFLSEYRNDRQEPVNDVWVMDADGTNGSVLYAAIPHGGPLYWSPEGGPLIAFHSPRAGNFDIYTTVLGQEAPAPAEAAAPAPATVAPVDAVRATAVADVAAETAPASEPTGPSNGVLVGAAVAVIAVAGVLVAVYLARRGRAI
jgi:Tol biopolymer transport system component